jgi:hypothetical protein
MIMTENIEVQHIDNIHLFCGVIPAGFDLIEYERGTDPVEDGLVLYGFDEVDSLNAFVRPRPAFVRIS